MFVGGQQSNSIHVLYKHIILFTGANLFMNCALTYQLIRKGATVPYVSIKKQEPTLTQICSTKKQSKYRPKI